jgi:tellurite resistance protein
LFLELMTKEQQQLFLDVAITMAGVDEHLHLDEQAFLERVQREVGDRMSDPQDLSHSDLVAQTRSAFGGSLIAARAFLIELAGLVIADGNRSDVELALLHELADAAGVPSADVPLFLDFAQRAVDLADDAQDLLTTSNVDRD